MPPSTAGWAPSTSEVIGVQWMEKWWQRATFEVPQCWWTGDQMFCRLRNLWSFKMSLPASFIWNKSHYFYVLRHLHKAVLAYLTIILLSIRCYFIIRISVIDTVNNTFTLYRVKVTLYTREKRYFWLLQIAFCLLPLLQAAEYTLLWKPAPSAEWREEGEDPRCERPTACPDMAIL